MPSDKREIDKMINDRRAWRARNLTESEDRAFWERFDRSPDYCSILKNVRDVQILLARGLEFAAKYNEIAAFITPDGGYCIDAKNIKTGEIYEYVADDLDEFGRDAMFGPYPLAEVVGKWTDD